MSFNLKKLGEEQVKGAAIAAILAFLKDLGIASLQELSAGLDEYRKESKTPDGWTKEEYLNYAIGRLTILKEQDIGPWFLDSVLDYGIGWLIDELEERLADDDDEEEPPIITPPVVDPKFPPYDYLWPSVPPAEGDWYTENSVLWRASIQDPVGTITYKFRVTKGEVGYPGEEKIARFKTNPDRWDYI